jgi:acetyl-CoA synthetase
MPGRYWQIVDDLKVSIFYTAPTAIRAIARAGDEPVKRTLPQIASGPRHRRRTINPEAVAVVHETVGNDSVRYRRHMVADGNGGVLISPVAGITNTVPGSATRPLPGVEPVLLDDEGKVLRATTSKEICVFGGPGLASAHVYGDHARFRDTYFRAFLATTLTGDGCVVGREWIHGVTRTGWTMCSNVLGTD